MLSRRTLLGSTVIIGTAVWAGQALAAEKITVVATFSILADMARVVGGDRVDVRALVGPNSDAHVYQPTPADVRLLANARVLVSNGLGFEGWMARLVKSAAFKGKAIVASDGVETMALEHGHKGTDPHAWQSLANARVYVANIRDGLGAADPEGRAHYEGNAANYLAAIADLEADVKRQIAALPPDRRRIISSHDAFGYFSRAYGFEFLSPENTSTESEASARDVARIIRQIKAQRIPAVFLENVTDRRLLDQIARETGAKIGGTIYSDALSAPSGPAGTYLEMFRHNVKMLTAALAS